MAADGFSVKTALAQMGNVARTQLKGQQGPQATSQQVKRPGEDQSRVEQVRKTEDSQQSKLDPDARQQDERRRRKRGRRDQDTENDRDVPQDDAEETGPGQVLDLKA
ncbi:MAG TPA: hypothetical protein P5571_06210 [Candidatus Krumholzibacteria bacterium]|nr:hypothetical protein [Candidatus Krumholzibacteria bacterium]HRX50935.1 hypothetical protein [Candidatus Krumholzibacteria bacterium]